MPSGKFTRATPDYLLYGKFSARSLDLPRTAFSSTRTMYCALFPLTTASAAGQGLPASTTGLRQSTCCDQQCEHTDTEQIHDIATT